MKRQYSLWLLFTVLLLYLLQGCDNMATVTKGVAEFNAAIKSRPELLSNQTIIGARLNRSAPENEDGVVLENIIIRNLTLQDVQMRGARLKNVTFVDCKFIKTDFNNSTLSNVKFIRGTMTGHKKPDSYDAYQTSFDNVSIDRVLFDGVYFERNVDLNLHGGIVVMRNITTGAKSDKATSLLAGSNLQVRMDNCTVINQIALLVVRGENNTAYITNSRFSNTTSQDNMVRAAWDPVLNLIGKTAWIEKCTLEAGSTPAAERVVVTDCVLGDVTIASLGKESAVFLTNNQYISKNKNDLLRLLPASKNIHDSVYLYLYAGGETIPQELYTDTGNVSIFDAKLGTLSMRQQRFGTALPNLNLSNVTIKSGDLEYADWRQGKWENVKVYPPVDLSKAKIGPIIGHNVEFPQGSPWRNGTLSITTVHEPLKFDRPPVPTLEELGLAQFWRENDFPVENY